MTIATRVLTSNMSRNRGAVWATALIALLLALAAPTAEAALVHKPDGKVQGRTVGEWEARYWEHLLEPPLEISPYLGRGELCPVVGRVLLAVTENGTVRSCTVEPGTHIYVAMSSVGCSTVEPEPFFGGPDLASLRACATAFLDTWVISHSLTIDGRPIDLTPHRHVSPRFTLELPQPNVLDTNETTALAATAGWAVITHPLRPGTHTIEYRARRDEGSGPADGGYTYTINVVRPRHR
jgi:hypothetical protein